MKKYHYVYHSYEKWGRDYIGVRSCNCPPEEDTKYFGSFKDKTFSPTEKTILFVCETRKEAAEIEIELHDFFDVAVNPQFANRAKATSTKFDTTGLTKTEAQKKAHSERMSGKNHPMFGMSGEKNHRFGVPNSEAQKKAHSERMSGENNPVFGLFGALHHNSKAIIAIKPDGTELHFGGICEAARELGIDPSHLSKYLKTDQVLKWGKFKGWRFIYENP